MALTRRLIVEGPQDIHVIDHICLGHGIMIKPRDKSIEPPFELKPQGGFDGLRKELGVAVKGSGLTHVGVVIDADEETSHLGISTRWCSIRDLLRDKGYDCPELPDPAGMVVEQEGRPRVGVWIMPDNLTTGKLETFLATLASPDSHLWAWARAALDTVPDCPERFLEKDRPKALVYTYLAVQKEPGSPLGLAISQSYFRSQAGLAPRFVAWIRSVFEL